MGLYLNMAWRNIWRHRRRTLIVVLAVGIGLWMMMWYDGMVAGFKQAIYGNAVQVLGGNIQVHAVGFQEKLEQNPLLPVENDQAVIAEASKLPQVILAARRIVTGGMVTNREGAFSVNIVGIEPEKEAAVCLEAKNVSAGRFLTSQDKDAIFIGKGLASAMNVTAGDRITLTGRDAKKQMRKHTMTVVGVYDLGMSDIEKRSVYLPLADAQYLYNLDGQSSEVAITLKQIGEEGAVIGALKAALPGYEYSDWSTNFPEMTSAIETKSFAMNMFGVIVMAVAGIGVLNMLLMAVYERTREIGLMGALGMKPHQIRWLFVLEGAMIGLVGVVMGIVLGLVINGVLGQVGIDYSKFSGMTSYTALVTGRVYTTLGLENIWWRAPIILLITILFALYPAFRASQREPAEALHYV